MSSLGGFDPEPGTIGARVLEIRKLLGGERKPLPYRALVDLIREKAKGYEISVETVRRFEMNERTPDVDQVKAIVSADPKGRPPEWLAWGTLPTPNAPPSKPGTELLAHKSEARIREADSRAANEGGKKRGGHGKRGA
jgi:transcriptional regulator with XRE-family HTH domain